MTDFEKKLISELKGLNKTMGKMETLLKFFVNMRYPYASAAFLDLNQNLEKTKEDT